MIHKPSTLKIYYLKNPNMLFAKMKRIQRSIG